MAGGTDGGGTCGLGQLDLHLVHPINGQQGGPSLSDDPIPLGLGKPGQGEQEHGALADQAGFLDPAKLDQAAAAAGIGDGRKGGMGLLD